MTRQVARGIDFYRSGNGEQLLHRFGPSKLGVISGAVLFVLVAVQFEIYMTLSLPVAISRIPEATLIVEEELERTRAERDAFEAFYKRVSAIDPVQPTSNTMATPALKHGSESLLVHSKRSSSTPDQRLKQVRNTYRETVMDVDHYEDEYDEPLAEHLAEELGVDLRELPESQSYLTPNLKKILLASSKEASSRRTSLVQAVTREAELLEEFASALRRIHSRRDNAKNALTDLSHLTIREAWNDLDRLEDECNGILERRQEHLQASYQGTEFYDLQVYLYQERDWQFPVLGDTLDIYISIQEVKDQIVHSVKIAA